MEERKKKKERAHAPEHKRVADRDRGTESARKTGRERKNNAHICAHSIGKHSGVTSIVRVPPVAPGGMACIEAVTFLKVINCDKFDSTGRRDS